MNKSIFLILTMFIFLFSFTFVSAVQPSVTVTSPTIGIGIKTPTINNIKLNTPFDFNFHIFNATDGKPLDNSTIKCYFHLYNSTGDHIYSEICSHDLNSDHQVPNEFVSRISAGNFSTKGSYSYIVQCNNSLIGGNAENFLEVTPTGEPIDNMQLYSRIFLILLSLLLIFVIQWNKTTVDYDKWYDKLVKKYQEKNWFKWGLSSLGYNFLKNSYIFSYLVGLLGLLILTDLAFFFNITSALAILKIVLEIYTWSSIAVCLVFFSQVQEWIVGWIKDIQDMNWGTQK